MIQTSNFRAWNERIETRVLVKSQNRRKSALRGHGSYRGQKAQSPSADPKARTQWKKTFERFWSQRKESFWKERQESVRKVCGSVV